MDYVPPQQQLNKLEDLELLVANPTVIPTYRLSAFLFRLCEMETSEEAHRAIKRLYDSLRKKNSCTLVVPDTAFEVQLTRYTAEILTRAFPKFKISIESDNSSLTRNPYTPFKKSRRDISGFIPILIESNCVSANAATIGFSEANGVERGIKSMTIEAKVAEIKDKDIYQLLANMEITATHIAKQLLSENIPLREIKVFGALLYCQENFGILFSLKMDFVNSKSEVRRLYKKLSIVQTVSYICHKLSTQE